jgi:hypothetical protein
MVESCCASTATRGPRRQPCCDKLANRVLSCRLRDTRPSPEWTES